MYVRIWQSSISYNLRSFIVYPFTPPLVMTPIIILDSRISTTFDPEAVSAG